MARERVRGNWCGGGGSHKRAKDIFPGMRKDEEHRWSKVYERRFVLLTDVG
jgi:hypothetical protein